MYTVLIFSVFSLLFILTNGQEQNGFTQEISTNPILYSINTQDVQKNSYPQSSTEPLKIGRRYRVFSHARQHSKTLESSRRNNIKTSTPSATSPNYPTYKNIPKTSFSCSGKAPGHYADIETGCQVFRVCADGLSKPVSSFLCPNGSLFNQLVSACDWWTNVDCKNANQHPPATQLTTIPITQSTVLTTQQLIEQSAFNYNHNFATSAKQQVQQSPEQQIIETKQTTQLPAITAPRHRFIPPRISTESISSSTSTQTEQTSSVTSKTNRDVNQNEVSRRRYKSRYQRPDGRYKYSRTEIKSRNQKQQSFDTETSSFQPRRDRTYKKINSFSVRQSTEKPSTTTVNNYRFSFTPSKSRQRTRLPLRSQQTLSTTEKPVILTTTPVYESTIPTSTQTQHVKFVTEPNFLTTTQQPETFVTTFKNGYSLPQIFQTEQITNIPFTSNLYSHGTYSIPQQILGTNQPMTIQPTFNTIRFQNIPITEQSRAITENQQILTQPTFNTIGFQNIPSITQSIPQNLPIIEKSREILISNDQEPQLNENQSQTKSLPSTGIASTTESADITSITPQNIEKQKILAITSGYNYLLPGYTKNQPPLKYTPTIDFKNSARLLSEYFNADIRPKPFSLPSTSSQSAPISESAISINTSTSPVPPTTLKLTTRAYPIRKAKAQSTTETSTLPTLSTSDKLQGLEITEHYINSEPKHLRFNQRRKMLTTPKAIISTTTARYTYTDNPLLTTLPLQYTTVPLTTVTTLANTNLFGLQQQNQGQLLLGNTAPEFYTLPNNQASTIQQSSTINPKTDALLNTQIPLNLNQGQLPSNKINPKADALLNTQSRQQQQQQQQLNVNQGQLFINNIPPTNQIPIQQLQILNGDSQSTEQITLKPLTLPALPTTLPTLATTISTAQDQFQQQQNQGQLFINSIPPTNQIPIQQLQILNGDSQSTEQITPKPLTLPALPTTLPTLATTLSTAQGQFLGNRINPLQQQNRGQLFINSIRPSNQIPIQQLQILNDDSNEKITPKPLTLPALPTTLPTLATTLSTAQDQFLGNRINSLQQQNQGQLFINSIPPTNQIPIQQLQILNGDSQSTEQITTKPYTLPALPTTLPTLATPLATTNTKINPKIDALLNTQIGAQQQNQPQLFINNIPPTNQIPIQQLQILNGGSQSTPEPLTLSNLPTTLRKQSINNVTPKTITTSNVQTNPTTSIVEIVPALSFSFDIENERKEYVNAILDGNLFDIKPDKDNNLSLAFTNQGFDFNNNYYFPFAFNQQQQQQQQQLTTLPQFLAPTTSYILPQTTIGQSFIPQFSLAPQPIIQQQQVRLTQTPLQQTTSQVTEKRPSSSRIRNSRKRE